jgi:GNAT superfamily N-acetyltransferase
MAIEIYHSNDVELANFDLSWSSLWWDELEEAGVEFCYFAFDGDELVGFQSISGDHLCVAIEVRDDYQGKGIGKALVEESNCWKPERNECPDFWEKMEKIYG